MSREVRRVPVDFDWPLNEVWSGYFMPDRFKETPCPDCKNGWSPRAQYLLDLWYGNVPFDPEDTGSERLTVHTPAVRAFAERNIASAPYFYGEGEDSVLREARRLAGLWNGAWCHHLTQADVDALVAAGRLRDFTHTWSPETRWQKIEPPVVPTAAQVNEWSLSGFGHDSINSGIAIEGRCKREGEPVTCQTCRGHGSLEKWRCQRIRAELWQPIEPPTGEGWQLWETVSEGSPITPVFATREGLVDHLCSPAYPRRLTRDEAEGLVEAGWVPSMIGNRNGLITGEKSEGDFARMVLDLPAKQVQP